MKLHDIETNIVKSGTVQEQAFTIKATSKAFSILSSGLYSDKMLAIIRELSCNAYDSHVAANKKTIPIEIKLPSALDPTLYIKDFGVGLSHNDIMTLYTTYFDSTKSDSNDFIGALGLGSKSPFSYVTSFVVESRFNYKKRIYSCFKNEQGLPAITLMTEQSTDEENGLTISLSIKKDDVYKCHVAAKKALMYFDPKPVIVGYQDFACYCVNHSLSGTDWKLRSAEYFAGMCGPHIVQGFVSYPIDVSLLKEQELSEEALSLLKVNIDVFVEIGEVEVAASREALSYNKTTISNICGKLERICDDIRDTIQSQFDECASKWEVSELFNGLKAHPVIGFAAFVNKLHSSSPFLWRGEPVFGSYTIDMAGIKQTTVIQYKLSQSHKRLTTGLIWTPLTNWNMYETPEINSNIKVLVDYDRIKSNKRILAFLQQLHKDKLYDITLIVICPIDTNIFDSKELTDVLGKFDASEYYTSEDLLNVSPLPRKQYTRKKTDKQIKKVWNYVDVSSFGKHSWTGKCVDLSAGGFYVPRERYSVYHNASIFTYFSEMITQAINLKIIPNAAVIVGMAKQDLSQISKNNKWINVIDYIYEYICGIVADPVVKKALLYRELYNITFNRWLINVFLADWDKWSHRIVAGQFKQFLTLLHSYKQLEDKHLSYSIIKLIDVFNMHANDDNVLSEKKTTIANIQVQYPMLDMFVKHTGGHWLVRSEIDRQRLIDYVNLIDTPKNVEVS